MNNVLRYVLIGGLALGLVACKKEEAAPVVQEAPLVVPTSNNDADWRPYVTSVIQKNIGNATRPLVYFLSTEPSKDVIEATENASEEEKQAKIKANLDEKYTSMLEQVTDQVSNGVSKENLLAFASPNSEKVADIVTEVFKKVPADSMKGARVLFIGTSADNDRIKSLIEPTSAEYIFINTK